MGYLLRYLEGVVGISFWLMFSDSHNNAPSFLFSQFKLTYMTTQLILVIVLCLILLLWGVYNAYKVWELKSELLGANLVIADYEKSYKKMNGDWLVKCDNYSILKKLCQDYCAKKKREKLAKVLIEKNL